MWKRARMPCSSVGNKQRTHNGALLIHSTSAALLQGEVAHVPQSEGAAVCLGWPEVGRGLPLLGAHPRRPGHGGHTGVTGQGQTQHGCQRSAGEASGRCSRGLSSSRWLSPDRHHSSTRGQRGSPCTLASLATGKAHPGPPNPGRCPFGRWGCVTPCPELARLSPTDTRWEILIGDVLRAGG